MNPKFLQIEEHFQELQKQLIDPSLVPGSEKSQQLAREFKKIQPAAEKTAKLRALESDIAELQSLLKGADSEMRVLAQTEQESLVQERDRLTRELQGLLQPRDPSDERNVIVEIRAGTGGNEAALFAGDLLRMYVNYAREKNYATEIYSSHPTGLGGFKEVIFGVRGPGAFRRFKHERGVHRVQRVPVTEAGGRIHTSTATVAVLPEVEDVEVEVQPKDLRIDTYRSSGAGGQHVNKTDSAVRITHLPTGLVVACQEERSQIKNRARAMKLLKAKIYQQRLEAAQAERRDLRRSQVGTGERSEKIRTYNVPQDRVTDHRLNQNFHNLPGILEGQIDDMVEALMEWEKAQDNDRDE